MDAQQSTKFSKTKISEHVPSRYLMSTIWASDNIENNHILNHGEDWMRRFCTSLREHAKNVTNSEKKKILSITKKS